MANKARYYGLATKEERQDMEDKSRASRLYPVKFGYAAIKAALLNYKDEHGGFGDLSSSAIANRLAKTLTETGLYGKITSESARIVGDTYSVSLTKHKTCVTISKATERVLKKER